ncbi:MAG: ImuA family protein [Hyphomicrobiaceae bacterium]
MTPTPPSSSPSVLAEQAVASRTRASLRSKGGAQAVWTLGAAPETTHAGLPDPDMSCAGAARAHITQLVLDVAGVHEIKPAGSLNAFDDNGASGDWASAWGAARTLALAMIARRRQSTRRPVLWCMPRRAQAEHGRLYSHGLRRFGLTPADVLIVETGNPQDTLWALEEGLKSESLALLAGFIDDVALTPARRLALAARKHETPCLLLTHPRMPPAAATATRWRVAAASGAAHPLDTSQAHCNGLGARRLAVTLERYRAGPALTSGPASGPVSAPVSGCVTGQTRTMEWSDEAVCLRLVADVSDRSDAARVAAGGA